MKVILRKTKRDRRKLRVRKKVVGTAERPRLSVFRSNKFTYAQLIDDVAGKTLVGVSAKDIKKTHEKGTKSESASQIGKKLAELALSKKIEFAVFDRNGYKYHGRIKMLADGAREGGLKF